MELDNEWVKLKYMNRYLKLGIIVVVTAIVVGIGTYFVVNYLSSSDKNNLNTKITSLKKEISSLNGQIANLKSNEISLTNSNNGVQTVYCQTSSLKASLSDGNGTAGAYYLTLSLKNVTSQTCHYDGYTTLFETDSSGSVVGQNASVSVAANINLPSGKTISSQSDSLIRAILQVVNVQTG